MKIGRFEIVRSKVVSFSWFWHRLTLKHNPAVYHWLWFVFGIHKYKSENILHIEQRERFEAWLRTVCFQKPTDEAYELAWQAWQSAPQKEEKKNGKR